MVGFLRCCVVGLLSLSVLAVDAAPVVKPASASDVFVKGGTTLNINNHWGEVVDVKATKVSPASKVTVPVQQARTFSGSRLVAMTKKAVKFHPGKIIATAGFLWLVDQIPGAEINDDDDLVIEDSSPKVISYATFQGTTTRIATGSVPGNCHNKAYQINNQHHGSLLPINSTTIECWRGSKDAGTGIISQSYKVGTYTIFTLNCPHGSVGLNCNEQAMPPLAFSEADYDAISSNTPDMPPEYWEEYGHALADVPGSYDYPDSETFTGPDSIPGATTTTTTTNPSTGQTTVTESSPVHNFDYSTDPLSITTTTTTISNTYVDGSLTSTTNTTTTTSPDVIEIPEIPTDCDFMPTVCSFIDWVKDPFVEEEPDLSDLIADDDFQKNIDFSSNASCPSPSIIATSQGSFEFSWEPACQWAGMVKPFIIIAALLAAIFINLGAIRGPN